MHTPMHSSTLYERKVLHLSRRWNLEKWKCCICILICPQSGIVFGVAVKFPDVCSSSLFIGASWETGLKFQSACYHSIWRWVFSLFSVCLLLPFLCHSFLASLLFYIFLHFFIIKSQFSIIAPYFFAIHPFFSLFHHTHHFSSPYPFLIVRTVSAYISLVVPRAVLHSSEGLQLNPVSLDPSFFFSPHPQLCFLFHFFCPPSILSLCSL